MLDFYYMSSNFVKPQDVNELIVSTVGVTFTGRKSESLWLTQSLKNNFLKWIQKDYLGKFWNVCDVKCHKLTLNGPLL